MQAVGSVETCSDSAHPLSCWQNGAYVSVSVSVYALVLVLASLSPVRVACVGQVVAYVRSIHSMSVSVECTGMDMGRIG